MAFVIESWGYPNGKIATNCKIISFDMFDGQYKLKRDSLVTFNKIQQLMRDGLKISELRAAVDLSSMLPGNARFYKFYKGNLSMPQITSALNAAAVIATQEGKKVQQELTDIKNKKSDKTLQNVRLETLQDLLSKGYT